MSDSVAISVACSVARAVQVLTALAAAQSLGFRHWDLRLKNIMEHTGALAARRVTHTEAAHECAGE